MKLLLKKRMMNIENKQRGMHSKKFEINKLMSLKDTLGIIRLYGVAWGTQQK